MRASVALGIWLVASVALADVAPPRPEDLSCPRGAVPAVPEVDPEARDPRGRPIQPWPYCAASTCTTDSDCDGGRVCSSEVIGLCVESTTVAGGGTVRSVRERGCEPDGTCLNIESTCEQARRCVAPEPRAAEADEAPEEEGAEEEDSPAEEAPPAQAAAAAGCGCRSARGSTHGGLIAVSLALAFLARRRRAP